MGKDRGKPFGTHVHHDIMKGCKIWEEGMVVLDDYSSWLSNVGNEKDKTLKLCTITGTRRKKASICTVTYTKSNVSP